MRRRSSCALAGLLLASACGGSAGHRADGSLDPPASDASIADTRDDAGAVVDGGGEGRGRLDLAAEDARDLRIGVDTAASEAAFVALYEVGAESLAAQDAGPRDPCDPAATVALSLPGAGSVTTAGVLSGVSRLVPKTPDCTGGDTGPEVVYALDVPAGEFHLVAATAGTADTVVYVQSACGTGVELACNDDAELPGPSRLTMALSGPRRIFLVVDSLATDPQAPENAFTLTVTLTAPLLAGKACTPAAPHGIEPCGQGLVCPPAAGPAATCAVATGPVVESAELFPQLGVDAREATLYLSAHDLEGDWKDLTLTCKSPGGVVLGSTFYPLSESWGLARLREEPITLALPADTASVDVTIVDAASLASTTVNVPRNDWAGKGQACDGRLLAPDPCLGELSCVAGTCAANDGATAACGAATPIALGVPVSGSANELTADRFEGSCHYDRRGNDRVFRATLPALPPNAVAWDLVAATANPAVPYRPAAQLDSYLYVRDDCGDPMAELACADDLSDDDLRSQVEVTDLAPGDYYVYLDTSSPEENGTAAAFSLLVTGRPVLTAGSPCDPKQLDNRCVEGACSALTALCP